MRTGEGVSGCRTVSPRRMSAEPCAEETAPRATVMGRASARRAELPRPEPDRRRRCPELGLGLGERRAGGIEACCGLVTSLVHDRDRRRSRRGSRAGGGGRRGEELKDPGSAAAVELLGARLACCALSTRYLRGSGTHLPARSVGGGRSITGDARHTNNPDTKRGRI
jgi:hypothetical protein